MEDTQVIVNKRIKYIIDDYEKCSQKFFAEKIGVSQSAISSLFSQRENKPGLDMLQKIAIAYPELSLDWLLIGRGSMFQIRDANPDITEKSAPQYLTIDEARHQYDELVLKIKHEANSYIEELWEKDQRLQQIYRIGDVPPNRRKLTDRLDVTSEEATELVLSGRIRSTYVGKDIDIARQNGVNYRISESAVCEFLGDITGNGSTF